MLTKKKLAFLTVLMAALFFTLMLFLPESVVGTRAENTVVFATKIGFLSMTAAMTAAAVLILIFKRDFVRRQVLTFNRFKHLLRLLVKRDFVSRYRKSVLGVLWSLLNPLLTMFVMTLVFSYLFRFQIENFPVYLLSGQIIFGFFSESTTLAMGSVVTNESIIKKVYVPKYIFPLARVFSSLVNLAFSFLAFLIVFLVTRVPFRLTMLLLPIPIIYTFVFSLGVAMLLSSMAVFFRDLTYLYGIFITLLTYLTPLFYPVEILPERMIPIIGFNPMYHFIDYFRDLALRGVIPGLWSNAVCAGFALAALCCGTYVFMSKQERYILYM
ncbi:MAG: ABC transporter permease [Oscillospiraceae bacterium]|nr:ABC transporter permease [Oscillospiraceae bacterium]